MAMDHGISNGNDYCDGDDDNDDGENGDDDDDDDDDDNDDDCDNGDDDGDFFAQICCTCVETHSNLKPPVQQLALLALLAPLVRWL